MNDFDRQEKLIDKHINRIMFLQQVVIAFRGPIFRVLPIRPGPRGVSATTYCGAARRGGSAVSDYPEHDKLRAVKEQSQVIGEFLDWLEDGGYKPIGRIELAVFDGHELCSVYHPKGKLLAAYFEIDEEKLEREKLVMLDTLRKAHGG